MKTVRNIIGVALISALVSFTVVYFSTVHEIGSKDFESSIDASKPVLTSMPGSMLEAMDVDFTVAAERTLNAVVHVKTAMLVNQPYTDPFYQFFYGRPAPPQEVQASGSGVILSSDGYVVTNNHVIKNSESISVVTNDGQTFSARVIGEDPTTDLALLKVEADGLPFITYGNSDQTKVGEWVLAVGNPFNLTSTVTAGIVSAKGRNINILGSDPRTGYSAIESFIQTDAAVNPGNSGGALVNIRGELIGINSAIKSSTGSYVGYSFAIPVNIVRKVVDDLMEYGVVQRAFIGVNIRDIDKTLMDQEGLKDSRGVYVTGTTKNSAAEDAGIEKGDVIVKVGSVNVQKVAELQEQISQFRPGDKVKITMVRGGEEVEKVMTLKNYDGSTELIKKDATALFDILGARIEEATKEELEKLNLTGGMKVVKLWNGKLMHAGIREGYIITRIDKQPVASVDDINRILEGKRGGVLFEGVYPNGKEKYYGFGM